MTDTSLRRSGASRRIEGPHGPHGRWATIAVDGRIASYRETGEGGPTVLLAHVPDRRHERWEPLVQALSVRYRVLTPDLLGYGRLERPTRDMRLHPWSDCSVLLALAERAGEPVHLVGHSYGGAVALETARALGKRALSLTLIEPIGFHLLHLAEPARESREIRTYCRLATPTRLVVGQHTPAPARVIVDQLLRTLPDAALRVLPRAGHMSPFTHPAELSVLISEHIDCVQGDGDPDCDDSSPQCEDRRSIA
jgi:pimeloyl-ACP methyl ester carboxylesterase